MHRDVRFTLRLMVRHRLVYGAMVVMIALAVAVAASAFGIYSHLALRDVPGVQQSQRLVSLGMGADANMWHAWSHFHLDHLRESLTAVESLHGAAFSRSADVIVADQVVASLVVGVSPGMFRDFGVPLVMGEYLDRASATGLEPVAIVSESFWRDHLGASSDAIGETIDIGQRQYSVVGVTGGGFRGLHIGSDEHVWVPAEALVDGMIPAHAAPGQRPVWRRSYHALKLYGRLAPGATISDAENELRAAAARWRETFPQLYPSHLHYSVIPGAAEWPIPHRRLVVQSRIMLASAVLLLLVTALNIACLMFARGLARNAEFATRLAVGASRGALVRQVLVECGAITTFAAASGAMLHLAIARVIVTTPPFSHVPQFFAGLSFDWRVAAFIVVAALVVALVAGLVPAMRLGGSHSVGLHQPARVPKARVFTALVGAQLAGVTIVVLASALMVTELVRINAAPLGFEPDGVHTMQIGLARMPASQVPWPALRERGPVVAGEIVARLQGIGHPAAVATAVPFAQPPFAPGTIDGPDVPDDLRVHVNNVTGSYFEVLGIPIVRGRVHLDTEPLEAVVSRRFALQVWGRDDVLGESFTVPLDSPVSRRTFGQWLDHVETYTVVGVAGDIRFTWHDLDTPAIFYRAYMAQLAYAAVITKGVSAASVQPAVEEVIDGSGLPVTVGPATPLTEHQRRFGAASRMRTLLAGGVAALTLLVAMIGVYASLHYVVQARQRELAVRKALGALPGSLVAATIARAMGVAAAAVAVALTVVGVAGEHVTALPANLDARDWTAWLLTAVVVLACAAVAAAVPARQAGRADPATVLRHD